ncbi:MAG: phage tail protein [Desulfarculus sp.]|nr:phage tail protein [Desulfarculus sp.]
MAAGLSYSAHLDTAQRARVEALLANTRNGFNRVGSRAVNHVRPGVGKEMVEAVRQNVPLKVSVVRKALRFTRATVALPKATTWLKGYPVPLSFFPHTPRTNFPYTRRGRASRPARGVSAMLDINKGARVIDGTFIVKRSNTWRFSGGAAFEVVERVHETRLPIRIVHGPAPGEILARDKGRIEGIVKRARDRLRERINHELRFAFRQDGLLGFNPRG